jgi:hypothetical protein
MLLFEQLDQSPVLRIEVTLYLKHYPVTENEVRGVATRDEQVVLVLLILPANPRCVEVISYFAFKARTKPVCLAFAVLMESSGHLLKSQDLRQTQ